MKTFTAKPDTLNWYVVGADNKTLGRLVKRRTVSNKHDFVDTTNVDDECVVDESSNTTQSYHWYFVDSSGKTVARIAKPGTTTDQDDWSVVSKNDKTIIHLTHPRAVKHDWSVVDANGEILGRLVAKPEILERHWYVVDAAGKTLGRLATELGHRLRGKHKAEYTPHVDTGDYIVVLNAEKITVTGNKRKEKIYYRYTGYVGGLKQATFEEMIARHPERVIEIAVKGMLPKGPLGREMYRKLKVYAGNEHQHAAQQPQVLNI